MCECILANAFAGKKDPHGPKQFIPEYQHTEAKGNRKVYLESWLPTNA
jgi:hypothetical protein